MLPLPLTGLLRLAGPSQTWFKPALSVVASVAPPNLLLVALGRLDLAGYTMAGSLCALYAHNRPYAARARVLAWVVLGMLTGLAAALVTASLTGSAVVLVTVGALLAAGQKAVCDASRIGPPGNVIFAFVSSASLFAPQQLWQVPAHVGLAALAGAWAWAVGMAPGLLRPHGPERRATAAALRAAAAYAYACGGASGSPSGGASGDPSGGFSGGPEGGHARAAAAAALHTAWQTLAASGPRSAARPALERLLTRAEAALAAPRAADPALLRAWAHALRGSGPLPAAGGTAAVGPVRALRASTPAGASAAWPTAGPAGPARVRDLARTVRARCGAVGPLAVRTGVGCALAGYGSLALGVGRPYWALVTAASLYQANVTLTWSRGVQRVVGNLLGVVLFAALAPLTQLSPWALVLCCVALNFGAEALITRNYWLGSVCVTPMALLISDFARHQEPGALMADRVLDTLVGALVGFAAAIAVTNRRAGDRIEHALAAVHRARERSDGLLSAAEPDPGALTAAHRALTGALVDLRAAADTAAGEWWQRAVPAERVLHAERTGHRTLAVAIRRQAPPPAEGVHV
ncbi:FUSC family protein [Actinacidiphila epipremni]|uniref:FUSC family protein n=1 Tax=Actinacidiphila epipremni TaxID=2053013 RepID=A0ABX0ZQZ8_9ACTN|nr:FUSC family protein [Actinacidiphila epipremni]NJP44694.1 FUSC family protein [Actinacidiphila epipremni]